MKLLMAMMALVLMTNIFAQEKASGVGEQSATATTCKDILDSQKAKGTSGTPEVPPVKKDSSAQGQ